MSVTVDTSRLNRILRNVDGDVEDVINTVAFSIERLAKTNAAVDTGAMRASIYTKTKRGGRAPAHWDGVTYVELPEPGKLEAIVGPTTHYAIHVELGTSRAAAQPFLTPAAMSVADDLERDRAGGLRRALEGR